MMIKKLTLFSLIISLSISSCSSGGSTPENNEAINSSDGSQVIMSFDQNTQNVQGTLSVTVEYDASVIIPNGTSPVLKVDQLPWTTLETCSSNLNVFCTPNNELNTNNLPNGEHEIAVILTLDDQSSIIDLEDISVNNLSPTADLQITSPTTNEVVKGNVSIQISYPQELGTADSIIYQIDSTLLPSCDDDVFCIWDSTGSEPGIHIVKVQGVFTNNTTTHTVMSSVPVVIESASISDDLIPPTVNWLNPSSVNEQISGTVSLQIEATDNVGVNSVTFMSRVPGENPQVIGDGIREFGDIWTIQVDTTETPDNVYELIAIATDLSNNPRMEPLQIVVSNSTGTGTPNIDEPCVRIINPVLQEVNFGNSTFYWVPTVSNTVSILSKSPVVSVPESLYQDCGTNVEIDKIEYYLDGVLLGQSSAGEESSWVFYWPTTLLNNGLYNLTAIAYDTEGNPSATPICGGTFGSAGEPDDYFACIKVRVDNGTGDFIPPDVTILGKLSDDGTSIEPLAGAQIAGNPTIVAQATDNVGIQKVEFIANGVVIDGCTDTNLSDGPDLDADGSPDPGLAVCLWDTTFENEGAKDLIAKATDTSGNTDFSDVVSVILVDAVPPTLTMRECVPADGFLTCYAGEYQFLNPTAFSIGYQADGIDNNAPPQLITWQWLMGDEASPGDGPTNQTGTHTYTTLDPAAPNFLVEVAIVNEAGLQDNELDDGSKSFFVVYAPREIWPLSNAQESLDCELDWPSTADEATPDCPTGNTLFATAGAPIVIRNVHTALQRTVSDDKFRGQVIVMQFFIKDETTAINDMNNHILPYFEGNGFPASSVEIISIGLGKDPVTGNDSFISVEDLADWHLSNGYNWTFVWDEDNILMDQYTTYFEGSGWAGGVAPRYLIMDRNHFVRLSDQGSLDEITGAGGTLGEMLETLWPCFGNPTCIPKLD